jgi:integrase/recombinase XerD
MRALHRTGGARVRRQAAPRAGGWERLGVDEQIDAIVKARAFASWLMVTGQLSAWLERFRSVDNGVGEVGQSAVAGAGGAA